MSRIWLIMSHTKTSHVRGMSHIGSVLPGFLRFGWVTSHLSLFPVTKNVPRHICHISGKNVTLSHTKILFLTCDVFCLSFPTNVTFWSRRYKNFLNGRKCDDSTGTETCFSLPVSGLSLISEAWSGKAIWAKTDPYICVLPNTASTTHNHLRGYYVSFLYICISTSHNFWRGFYIDTYTYVYF